MPGPGDTRHFLALDNTVSLKPGITETLMDLRNTYRSIAQDFSAWPSSVPRLVDELEAMVSVLLAILCAHLIGARNVGWAAFSGYMVMRSHVEESFRRGALRVAGTASGAALAWYLSGFVSQSLWLLSAALTLIGTITLYFAIVSQRSYAWLFSGLTFSMVLLDAIERPGEVVGGIAWSRFLEVTVGTCVCVCVSAISTYTVRRRLLRPTKPAAPPEHVFSSPDPDRAAIVQHALQGGIALGLIPWAWHWFGIESLSQSSITIMAVMMVPLASLAARHDPTSTKMVYRFIGCCGGGALATLFLLASREAPYLAPYLMTLGVCVGVVIGRHIENGKSGAGYIGTQFALVFLVVLVPDSYGSIDIGPGLDRLVGITLGMVLLVPVRQVWRGLARSLGR